MPATSCWTSFRNHFCSPATSKWVSPISSADKTMATTTSFPSSTLPRHIPVAASETLHPKKYNANASKEHSFPGLANTPWNHQSIEQRFPALETNTSADVVLVGDGIAGLSCALDLARGGKNVVVLEGRVRGGGQTGRTTAHLMVWLDDYYCNAINMHGVEKAKLASQSLADDNDVIETNCTTENIECQFTRLDGILYPHTPSQISTLRKELGACQKLGMTGVKLADLGGSDAVGRIKEALAFPRNADFHPMMYLEGMADAVLRHGGRIFEGAKAWTVVSDRVETEQGRTVWCDAIVLATNSPINHNLAVHARQLPYRTFAIGILCPRPAFCRADYWSTETVYHYVRADDWDEDNYLVIVGGP